MKVKPETTDVLVDIYDESDDLFADEILDENANPLDCDTITDASILRFARQCEADAKRERNVQRLISFGVAAACILITALFALYGYLRYVRP